MLPRLCAKHALLLRCGPRLAPACRVCPPAVRSTRQPVPAAVKHQIRRLLARLFDAAGRSVAVSSTVPEMAGVSTFRDFLNLITGSLRRPGVSAIKHTKSNDCAAPVAHQRGGAAPRCTTKEWCGTPVAQQRIGAGSRTLPGCGQGPPGAKTTGRQSP